MKKIVIALSLALLICGKLLAQSDYVMFMSELLTPAPGKTSQLMAGVKAHNEKYHKEEANKAYLFSILTGPNSGKFVWIQGPMKYGAMDEPLTEDHQKDWDANIAAFCSEPSSIKFMRRDDELSYNPENETVATNYLARVFYGISDRPSLLEAIGMITKVYEAKKWTSARRVYTSDFRSQENEDVALVYPFASFSEFEKFRGIPTSDLEADFESVHGSGSFAKFIEMMQNSSEGWYDEIRVMVN